MKKKGKRASLDELTKKLVAFSDERNWKQFHNPKDLAISLSLEAAEVMEHFQWKNEKEMWDHVEKHRDEIGEELADVFSWVLLMSHDLGIDIAKAAEKKIQKNALKYPIEKAKGKHTKYNQL